MIKIHDCSNSKERPLHRGGGGPKTNDIFRYLHEHAPDYNCRFVGLEEADVIITNDVFPQELIKIDLPKVKRMDGVFWQNKYLQRNEPLNRAAQIADHVIFVSDYSKESYLKLYGRPLKKYSVIVNRTDDQVFYPGREPREDSFVASATSWGRNEKRFKAILKFAQIISKFILLIGHCSFHLPNNIIKLGYIESGEKMASVMRKAGAMVCFSYRDPAPKTVAQGSSCGLPILYADSGGTKELVYAGVGVQDETNFVFEEGVPDLKEKDIEQSYNIFEKKYKELKSEAYEKAVQGNHFRAMLDSYFNVIRSFNEA